MISLIAGWILPTVGEKAARPLAWVLLIILGLSILGGIKLAYDASVIESHVDGANVDFTNEANEATGRADQASDAREAEHEERIKTSQELIDEALEKGCSVGEYLASSGERCL